MLDCERLRERLGQFAELQQGATREEIRQDEQALGCTFPSDYVEFLTCTNGLDLDEPAGLNLFPTEEIADLNSGYGIPGFMPGWLLIGTDGGGEGILIDCTAPDGPIYRVPLVALLPEDAICLAPSLSEWVRDDFDLSAGPDQDDRIDSGP